MSSLPEPRPPGLDGGPGGQDSRRFAIALAVSMGLMLVMQSLAPQKKAPRPAPKAAVTAPATPDGTAPGMPPPTLAPVAPAAPAAPDDDPVLPETVVEMASKATHFGISSHGGRVVRAELPTFVEHRTGEKPLKPLPVDVVGSQDARGGSLRFAMEGLAADASYRVTEQEGGRVVMERDGAGLHVVRRLTLMADGHGLRAETEVTNRGTVARTLNPVMEFAGRIHPEERKGGGFLSGGVPTDQTGLLCETPEKLVREIGASMKDPVTHSGGVNWAGIDRQFFLGAAAFKEQPPFTCRAEVLKDDARVAVAWAPVALAPGATWKTTADAYFGPKQEAMLQVVNPVLANAVDYGWFGALVRLLLKLLLWFYSIIPNYGIAIMLLTLSVKLVTLPLTQRTFVSQQRMKTLSPKIKDLQAKYAHDKAMQGQKMMELYKQENASPMDGCFPMLVQMPIWIALYRTLYTAVELYQQPFITGWIDDLTQKDPFYITPVALGAVMLVQAFLTPTPPDQPQMKYMQYGMPIFFTTIMLALPAGLTVYMLVNTVLTILQQLYIKRRFGTPDTPAPVGAKA